MEEDYKAVCQKVCDVLYGVEVPKDRVGEMGVFVAYSYAVVEILYMLEEHGITGGQGSYQPANDQGRA